MVLSKTKEAATPAQLGKLQDVVDDLTGQSLINCLLICIEGRNNQLRKLQDRLGRKRAECRRLKDELLTMDMDLAAQMGEHIDFVDFEEGRYDNDEEEYKHVGLGFYRKVK